MNGSLLKKECESILKYSGFNNDAQSKIIMRASNCKKLKQAEQKKAKAPFHYANIIEDQADNPETYMKYELCSSWYDEVNILKFVDVPMHLLFLGITKLVALFINDYLKQRNQYSQFMHMMTGVFLEIQNLNLAWCKLLEYPSCKFGGWVAENYCALSRVFDWYCSLLKELPPSIPYKDPDTNPNTWNKITNERWLVARGLSKIGNAEQLRERVKTYMNNSELLPIVINNVADIDDVLTMIHDLRVMICSCMRENHTVDSVFFLQAAIRKFLISFDKIDSMRNSKKGPSWISNYNLLSLLNIPSIIKNYGSYRWLWEGGEQGEGFLRSMKTELKWGLRGKWQIWSLQNLLTEKSFNTILEKLDNNDSQMTVDSDSNAEFKIYVKKSAILFLIGKGRPISGMIAEQNNELKHWLCYRHRNTIYGAQVNISDNFITNNFMNYRELSLTGNVVQITPTMKQQCIGCLFLPKLCDLGYQLIDKNKTYEYCVIYSNWSN